MSKDWVDPTIGPLSRIPTTDSMSRFSIVVEKRDENTIGELSAVEPVSG